VGRTGPFGQKGPRSVVGRVRGWDLEIAEVFREVGRENGETLRSSLGEGRFGDGLEGGVGEATRLRSAEGFREFERWFFGGGFGGFVE
jgi:hypothetical protein